MSMLKKGTQLPRRSNPRRCNSSTTSSVVYLIAAKSTTRLPSSANRFKVATEPSDSNSRPFRFRAR